MGTFTVPPQNDRVGQQVNISLKTYRFLVFFFIGHMADVGKEWVSHPPKECPHKIDLAKGVPRARMNAQIPESGGRLSAVASEHRLRHSRDRAL